MLQPQATLLTAEPATDDNDDDEGRAVGGAMLSKRSTRERARHPSVGRCLARFSFSVNLSQAHSLLLRRPGLLHLLLQLLPLLVVLLL
jgi:hypothetical protein